VLWISLARWVLDMAFERLQRLNCAAFAMEVGAEKIWGISPGPESGMSARPSPTYSAQRRTLNRVRSS
jgi:hypothetical protein